jgi:hypothetical protein
MHLSSFSVAARFNKEANLKFWYLCGAVPLIRSALTQHSIQQEMATEENSSG